MIPSNCNNSEATQEIHLVCHKECFPKICFCTVCKMSDHGEAYLGAVGCEEDVFVDKEAINCQFNILLELDELSRGLDNTLTHTLAVPPHSVPFHPENRLAPNYLCGLYLLDGHIRPRDPPYTYNHSVSRCRGIDQFLLQVSSLYCMCFLLLA